jgi:hypothetical protein
MKNILQVQMKVGFTQEPLWFDFMELPENINDLRQFQDAAQKDYPDRLVRIVQVLEQ